MNTRIPLYQFTHGGDSITVARITHVGVAPGPQLGQETVTLQTEVSDNLWSSAEPRRSYSFQRPDGRIAQLKFPDPVWSRVNIREGAIILIITAPEGAAQNPLYVDEIQDMNDPGYRQLRDLLQVERDPPDPKKAKIRYLGWLETGGNLEKLFAGESLAQDRVLQSSATVIRAYLHAFASEKDVYTKVSLGTWLWDYIFPNASPADRIRIVNTTMEALKSPSPNVRDLALDRLSEIDPAVLREPGLESSMEAVRLLQERRAQETDAGVQHKLDEIIAMLRRRP